MYASRVKFLGLDQTNSGNCGNYVIIHERAEKILVTLPTYMLILMLLIK